jgi:D-alanyl-D-alanine carboxypeptidase
LPWAAGGIVSNAADLVRFFSALLSGRVVSQASLNEMEHAVQVPAGPGRYGLGLAATDLPCGSFWGHNGAILDYVTFVAASPNGKRVAVVSLRGPLNREVNLAALLCT